MTPALGRRAAGREGRRFRRGAGSADGVPSGARPGTRTGVGSGFCTGRRAGAGAASGGAAETVAPKETGATRTRAKTVAWLGLGEAPAGRRSSTATDPAAARRIDCPETPWASERDDGPNRRPPAGCT